MSTALRLLLALSLVLGAAGLGRAGDLFQAINNGDAAEVRRLLRTDPGLASKPDSFGNLPLHAALRGRTLDLVRALVEAKADVRALDANVGITPLHVAAANDEKEAAELLIAKGADVNAGNRSDALTPLHSAAGTGSVEVARLLLAKGADVEGGFDGKSFKPGFPPLHAAVRAGEARMVRLLLAKGANPNSQQVGFAATPLQLAAEVGDPALVRLLLAKGARVQAPGALVTALAGRKREVVELLLAHGADCSTPEPLLTACAAGDRGLVELLLAKGADVKAATRDGRTALHAAAQNGNPDVVALLLAKGADATARDRTGNTPLHVAPSGNALARGLGVGDAAPTRSGRAVAELLLARGADVNAANDRGQRPTFPAAQRGDRELLEFLAGKGAELDVDALAALGRADALRKRLAAEKLAAPPDEYTFAPLHVAVLFGQPGTAEVLLDSGADVNGAGPYGQTPLHVAAAAGNVKMVEFLLKHQANVNAPMSANLFVNQRATPLQLALQNGNVEVARLLTSKGALPKLDGPARAQWLRHAVERKQVPLVLWLEEQGTPMSPLTFGGKTPLHLAAEVGDRTTVERLLARGADPKAASQEGGFTPLHHAVRGQHQAIVELLLARGADVKLNAPLLTAVMTGNVEIAALLIAKGADVRAAGSLQTPLEAACYLGKAAMVKLLLDHGAGANKGDTGCLHAAALHGHRAVVELLLERGADVNGNLPQGFFLYSGAFQRQPEVLALLREPTGKEVPPGPGVLIPIPAPGEGVVVGGTPLLAAVAGRQRVIAELLLAKGADVRVRLPRGATLLNLAAVQGDVETMKLLLARGLDVAARDERGTTPLALALTAEQEEAAALLRARGAKE